MSEFITTSCPSCGENLQFNDENERIVCIHCGTEHLINRDGGNIAFEPVTKNIMDGDNVAIQMNIEEALNRLKTEKNELIAKRENSKFKNKDCKGYIFTWIGRVMFVVSILMIFLMRSSPFRHIVGGTFIVLGIVSHMTSVVLCSREEVKRLEKITAEINRKQIEINKLEEKLNENN